MIEIISATRLSEDDFWNNSALGYSLRRLSEDPRLIPCITFNNQRPLPDIYNERINAPEGNHILVFVHDDVWLDDYFLSDRLILGLESFDVIGVAGNQRRVSNQPTWLCIDSNFTRDQKTNLSGSIAGGKLPFGNVYFFGTAPAECELLDGVFLAARRTSLKAAKVQFDPRFDFHFYDMDFCRSARKNGLRLGTWPICITHQSGGTFNSPHWKEKWLIYQEKWGA